MFLIRIEEVAGSEVVVGPDQTARLEPHKSHSWSFKILDFVHIVFCDFDLFAS